MNNIDVIYLLPPKRKDYINACQTKFKEEYRQWWVLINEAIGGEKIVGAFDDLGTYNQDSVFRDAYHLNGAGQDLYSDFLKNALSTPSIITPSYNVINSSSN